MRAVIFAAVLTLAPLSLGQMGGDKILTPNLS